jgi:hypothetical protein
MEYVYDELYALKQQNSAVFNTESALMAKVKDLTHDYYNTTPTSWINENYCGDQSDIAFDEIVDLYGDDVYTFGHYWSPNESNNQHLTQFRKTYLDNLYTIINSNQTTSQVISDIEDLELSLSNSATANETDLFILLSASAIAKSSFSYWDSEQQKWSDLFADTPVEPEVAYGIGKEGVRTIGGADIAGAVGGAVRAGVLALFGPIGAGAAFGGIIAGGIGASAGAAVMYSIHDK